MDYLNYIDYINLCDRVDEQNISNRKRKTYKSRADPFLLDETDFKYKYKFTKKYVQKVLDLIKGDIIQDTRGMGVSPELQVLTALRTWARQEIQDDAADLHGLSQQSVTNICRRVAKALSSRANQFIFMPHTITQQEEVIAGFWQICGFRDTIGAIDCTHIKIKRVGRQSRQYYMNCKGYYSLNVQVVCDASLRIRDIVACWRGSTHDSRIFNESRLHERFQQGEFVGHLLGDAGYALSPFLFTPVNNPSTPKEEAYNKAHIHTRSTIERCFWLWKQRFRCLLTGFTVKVEQVKLYVVALAVLHNIAIDMGEEVDDIGVEIISPNEDVVPQSLETNLHGQVARSLFIQSNF